MVSSNTNGMEKERSVVERIAPSSFMVIARAVTAFEHTRDDGNMFSQAIAFLRFLIRFFFINCHFHPQEHEQDERKSFVLISVESKDEEKVSPLVGVKKFYLFRRQKRLMSSLDDYLISFSFGSNCWVEKKCFTA